MFPFTYNGQHHKKTRKKKNGHHPTLLLVGSANPETNVAEVEAVFAEVLNMRITVRGTVKRCLRFLDLALV